MMATTNVGWYFYREYYRALTVNEVGDFKQETSFLRNQKLLSNLASPVSDDDCFELYTTYPGLLIGSGYQHESGGENEFKIGFFFDYTTGLPQIPGSSVKGVLRSNFPGRDDGDLQASKSAFIAGLIKEVSGTTPGAQQVVDLEMEIFEGVDFLSGEGGKLSIYKRDRFFDGIISPNNSEENLKDMLFLGTDYITPHHDNPLGDPTPLPFLKVLPNVGIRFQFDLHDSAALPGFTAGDKRSLFKKLLLEFGIGAKTNVGYGQLRERIYRTVNRSPDVKSNVGYGQLAKREKTGPKKDILFQGEIVEFIEGKARIKFTDQEQTEHRILKGNFKKGEEKIKGIDGLFLQQKVTVRLNKDYSPDTDMECTVFID